MKWFTMVAVPAMFTVLFLSCEGTKTTTQDKDISLGDEDSLLADESVTDEEEPEGEETVKDDGPVAKDDGPVAKDDGPVVTDDAPVVTDDGTVEPDEDIVVTDDIVTDDVVTDDVVTDDVVTDDVVTDDAVTDDIQPDDDQIETFTIGWCNLQYPADATATQGDNVTFYGRVYIAGLTDLTAEVDTNAQVIGQLSGNPSSGVDAATWPSDGWLDLLPNPDNETAVAIGNNDEYMLEVPVMADPGVMDITVRFSGDGGATWTYCNANREGSEGYNGTDVENPYDPAKHGHLTVEAAYDDPCDGDNPCEEPNRSVCTDANTDGVAECACDENYTLDGGDTCINEKFVDCAANPSKPLNSHDVITQVKVNYTDLDGWGDPEICTTWDCNDGYHWNEDEEACLETLTIGWCNTQWPTDASWYRGEEVAVYGRLYIAGLTDQSLDVDEAPQVIVQVGSSPTGTSATDWMYWGAMVPNPDSKLAPGIGEDEDEYQFIGAVTETLGDWDHLVRVSGDSGATWTYCNANRPGEGYNGTDSDNPYDLTKNGHFTVTSPCGEGFCDEPNKSVCADSDSEPFYTCSCDTHYNDDDGNGTCEADRQLVDCMNALPENAVWDEDLPIYEGLGKLWQTWNDGWKPEADTCPWVCAATYHEEDGDCVSDAPRTVNCIDNKPETSHWVADGAYNGDGTVGQTWTGTEWIPPADECPWECDTDYHYENSSEQCVTNTIGRLCTNTLPTGADWVVLAPYDGEGNLIQTWVGPGDDDWTPDTDTCPWECTEPGYHENTEVNQCLLTYAIGWCKIQWPPTFEGIRGSSGETVYSRLWVDGVTDMTAGPDPLPQIKAQLGAGPRDTDPSTWGDLWMPAVPNGEYSPSSPDYSPNNDEYMAMPVLDMPGGLYDYAYRFSGDSGQTWTYCDLNGSSDGYTTDQAGKLAVYECDASEDCTYEAGKDICVTDDTDPMYRMCVECLVTDDCAEGNVCDTASYTCVECLDNTDCTDEVGLPVCDTANHNCVECVEDADCVDPLAYCTVDNACEVPPIGKFADWPLTTDGSPTNVATGVLAGSYSGGTGIGLITYGVNGAYASNWTTALSPDADDYFQITVTPDTGVSSIVITSINYSERRSSTGIRTYEIQYSIASDFSDPVVLDTITVPDDDLTRSHALTDLSIAVDQGETLYLRFFGYAAEASGGTWRIGSNALKLEGRIYPE